MFGKIKNSYKKNTDYHRATRYTFHDIYPEVKCESSRPNKNEIDWNAEFLCFLNKDQEQGYFTG